MKRISNLCKVGCPPRFYAPTTLSWEAVSTLYISREAEEMAAQLKPLPVSSFLGQGYRNLARAQAQTVCAEFLKHNFYRKEN